MVNRVKVGTRLSTHSRFLTTLAEQHEYNVAPGQHYEDRTSMSPQPVTEYPVRYIAYYLPQFHSIPENDEWWGTGFTEWSNTTKALPRYVGHIQPRLPADLGFYDLSKPDVLRKQVELAKLGGIYGFCIHNYWFSGRAVLETPLRILLDAPDIEMPFCLNWANESWSRRWDGSEQDVLLEQKYAPGDAARYIDHIAAAVSDRRYIRVDGRPLIMLYRPSALPDARSTVDSWRQSFRRLGLGEPYIVMAQAFGDEDPRRFGMDAAAGFPPHPAGWHLTNHKSRVRLLDRRFSGHVAAYEQLIEEALANRPTEYRLFPGVCPQWDNEARRPNRGFSLYGSTPARYGDWLKRASKYAIESPSVDERIVFINAWNEWAEGTYLEPDRHFGFAYLAETRRALESFQSTSGNPPAGASQQKNTGTGRVFETHPSRRNYFHNLAGRASARLSRRAR